MIMAIHDEATWLDYKASCLGKRSYMTEETANRFHELMLTKSKTYRRHKGKELQVYKCRFCVAWHIGNGRKAQ